MTELSPGGEFILIYQIENFDQLPKDWDVLLTITYPDGFVLKSWMGGHHSVVEATYSFTPTGEKGELYWVVGDESYGPYLFSGALTYAEKELAVDEIILEEANKTTIDETGGSAIGVVKGITVTVTIPDHSLAQAIDVRIIPPGDLSPPPGSLTGYPVRITAIDNVAGEELTKFDDYIIIQFAYNESFFAGIEHQLVLKFYDEATENWRTLSSIVDVESNIVTGFSDHLTDFDIDVQSWEMAQLPNLDAFQVSAFTGAASYSVPVWTPPGPGGFQPSVSLSYSSQTVDGASMRTQAGIAGMGWSLSAGGHIQRNLNGTDDDPSDDTFSIVAGGVSSTLLPIAQTSTRVEFRTVDESFWRIYAHKDASGTYQFDYWEAWDKTGNYYIFGGTDATRAIYPIFDISNNPSSPACEHDYDEVWYWGLRTTTNAHDETITYVYSDLDGTKNVHMVCVINDDPPYTMDDDAPAEVSIYLTQILFPNNKYRISFEYQNRYDYEADWADEDSTARVFFERKRLDRINVEHNYSQSNWETVRRFELTYADQSGAPSGTEYIFPNVIWPSGVGTTNQRKTQTLVRIQEFDGPVGGGSSLPESYFYYLDNMHLTKASNGYGGVVEFSYSAWYELDGVKGQSVVQDIGVDFCILSGGGYYGDQGIPWDNVSADTDIACHNKELIMERTDGSAVMVMKGVLAETKVKPGSWYMLFIENVSATDGGTLWLGWKDSTMSNPEYDAAITLPGSGGLTDVVSFQYLPATAKTLEVYIKCDPNGENGAGHELCTFANINSADIRVVPLTTNYRVTERKVYDEGNEGEAIIHTYSYDGAATNDREISDAVDAAWGVSVTDYDDYLQAAMFSQFRGHSFVSTENPDGVVTVNYFHQDDDRKGTAYETLSMTRSFHTSFESGSSGWNLYGSSILREDGDKAVRLIDTDEDVETWAKLKRTAWDLSDGEISLFRFKADNDNSVFQFGIEVDDSVNPNNFHAFHVRVGDDVDFDGTNNCTQSMVLYYVKPGASTYECVSNFTFKDSTWYTVAFLVDDDNLRVLIWDEDEPAAKQIICGSTISGVPGGSCPMSSFSGKTWRSIFYASNEGDGTGMVWLDEYAEGTLYSLTALSQKAIASPNVTPNLALPGGAGGAYEDLQAIIWKYTEWDASMRFEGGGESIMTGKQYYYDPSLQGGVQYGNATRTSLRQWNNDTYSWDEHSGTKTTFYPNTTNWLVGLPAITAQYKCPNSACGFGTADEIGVTIFLYDDNSGNWATSPTNGIMTGQRVWLDNLGSGGARRYGQTDFAYDTYGNQTSVTTYTGYGGSTWSPSGAQTTTTVYDSDYHTYPIEITNPLGDDVGMDYDFALGVPTSITDANGNPTTATYDGFGRMKTVCKVGDTCTTTASITLTYNDTASPMFTEASQKVATSPTLILLTVRKFYNGLGQLLQTQLQDATLKDGACGTVDGNPDTCDILVDYDYDDSGRLIAQSVPHAYANASGYVTPSWGSLDYTLTFFDEIGRPKQQIATDGSTVQAEYGYGLIPGTSTEPFGFTYTTVANANDVKTWSLMDPLGRTTEVRPAVTNPTTLATAGPWMFYEYDELGRLLQAHKVKKGAGETSGDKTTVIITYDTAGRKLTMDDPDMGAWSYAYDALGNLEWQKDAKDQVICFYYDNLNRLTGKQYRSDTNCNQGAPDVEFFYDNYSTAQSDIFTGYTPPSDNPIGRRTGMEDGSGHTIWAYDERGRLIEETKSITGYSEFFVTGWEYNNGDQLRFMTYPNGEEVEFTYLPQGLPNTVDSLDGNYLVGSTYDASGRLVEQLLRSAAEPLTLDYGYWEWDDENGLGRLMFIQATEPNSTTTGDLLDFFYGNSSGTPTPGYDAVGNITRIETDTPNNDDDVQVYGYDDLDRLTSWQLCNPSCPSATTYTYDDYGRLNGLPDPGTYTYQATSTYPFHAVESTSTGDDFDYDLNGNMTFRKVDGDEFDFAYDGDNRLAEVDLASADHFNFVYDGDGNRVKAIDHTTGEETYYVGNTFEVTLTGEEEEEYPYCAAPGESIPDDDTTGVSDTITVSGSGGVGSTISDLNVYLEVDHTKIGQLVVILEHESTSTVVQLMERPGVPTPGMCTGDDIDGLFQDDNPQYVAENCQTTTPALTGTFDPNGNLSDFDSESINGDWTLTVIDRGSGDTGTFVSWCLDPNNSGNGLVDSQPFVSDPINKLPVLASALPQRPSQTVLFSAAQWLARWVMSRGNVQQAGRGSIAAIDDFFERILATESPSGGEIWKSYYYAGGQRIAMRVQDGDAASDETFYLLGDHLGSTTVTANAAGDYYSELRYEPWGEVWYESTNEIPTDFQFTGQRSHESDFGLLYFNARWYDSATGRFTQADTILPDPGNPQAFDRYAYVLNNPVKYNDPTGHYYYDPGCECMVWTGNPGNEDPDNLTYVNSGGSVSPLELAFDPYYGTYVDDLQSGAIDEEALQNVDQVWDAAAIAYDVEDIDLDDIAANVEVNPLNVDDVAAQLYGDGSIDHMLFMQAAHEPYLIFLQVLGEKYDVDLMPATQGFMQVEANYLAALMDAHPVELAEAMVIYKQDYGDPRIASSPEGIENLINRIRFRWSGTNQ